MPKLPPKKTTLKPQLSFPYIVVGIDPGKAGGISWITPSRVITTTPMPEGEEDLYQLVCDLEELLEDETNKTQNPELELFVFIEQVHSMPQQSSVATFTFGKGYGQICQAFCTFSREFVRPQVWMKGLQIPNREKTEAKPKYKERLKIRARQLFPKLGCWTWNKGKQMAVADSILIMEYGRRKLLGGIK